MVAIRGARAQGDEWAMRAVAGDPYLTAQRDELWLIQAVSLGG